MSEYDIPVHVLQDSGKSHHKTLKVKQTLTKTQQKELFESAPPKVAVVVHPYLLQQIMKSGELCRS